MTGRHFGVTLQAQPDMLKPAHKSSSTIFLALVLLCSIPNLLWAQCTSPISVFPYTEGFESGSGNWTFGGTASSWAWGTPVKPVINSAATGTKCSVTGGLNGSAYNDNESSWLKSPCFDFSTLSNPQIKFNIFWETELQYDGANLQYSTDGGSSWTVLGSELSNNNCSGTNWYNYNSVQFIGFQPGWSGNIQTGGGNCRNGQGSGQWLPARHTLAMLAGEPQVIFRFQFGSGRICNGFDGFAVDDVEISEAPPNTATAGYTCGPSLETIFSVTTSPCAAAYSWNFGDPASGANNQSVAINPSHIFSAPGNYQVLLTVSYNIGPQVVVPLSVTVFSASATITSQPRCNGDRTGAAQISTNPASGAYSYSWTTNPPQSSNAVSNLPAGDYSATVSLNNGCTVTLPVSITQPDALAIQTQVNNEKCKQGNGAITATVTGGIQPYDFTWSNAASSMSISGLSAGNYKLSVSDANGCRSETGILTVDNINNPVNVSLGGNQFICPGQTVTLNPGNFASYLWQDLSTSPTFMVSQTGTYSVVVTDQDGCRDSAKTDVKVECRDIYFPTAFTPGSDGRNDGFGPIGDVASLKNYVLSVYGRWGQLLYTSVNPLEKWDGRFQGQPVDLQTCVWIATFTRGARTVVETRKGYLVIIR